jgi:hypothetical protein
MSASTAWRQSDRTEDVNGTWAVLSIVADGAHDELAGNVVEYANLGVTAHFFIVAGAIPVARLTNEVVGREYRSVFDNSVLVTFTI